MRLVAIIKSCAVSHAVSVAGPHNAVSDSLVLTSLLLPSGILDLLFPVGAEIFTNPWIVGYARRKRDPW